MFLKIKAMVLAILGAASFNKVEGKDALTEDQRETIKNAYGEQFLKKFEDELSASQEDDHEVTTESVNALVAAISDHAATVTSQTSQLNAQLQKQVEQQATQMSTLQDQVAQLSRDPEEDPVVEADASLPRKKDVDAVIPINKLRLAAYGAVNHFMKTGRMNDIEAATINVADLATEFGTYLSQGRNNLDLTTGLFQGFSSAPFFTNAMGTTEWRAVQALISSVSQQFTNKWTPSGGSKFRPLTIRNRRHKINFPIIPSDVLESYMMHMYDEGLAIDQMPITVYIWNQLIYPQLMQDIELRMIFKGKFVDAGAVSEGDAGKAPEDSMDGIETILVDGLDGSKNIHYFDGQGFDYKTATDAEVLKFVQDFVAWLSPVFRRQNMDIGCSDEFYRRYKIAYKNVWGAGSGTQDADFGGDRIDFSRQVLQPMDGMYGSPILFTTPSSNLKKLRHKNDVPRVVNDVQKVNYEVRIFGEYWLGAGFAYGEGVFAYVPANYNPKALITSVNGAHTEFQQARAGAALGSGSAGGGL